MAVGCSLGQTAWGALVWFCICFACVSVYDPISCLHRRFYCRDDSVQRGCTACRRAMKRVLVCSLVCSGVMVMFSLLPHAHLGGGVALDVWCGVGPCCVFGSFVVI